MQYIKPILKDIKALSPMVRSKAIHALYLINKRSLSIEVVRIEGRNTEVRLSIPNDSNNQYPTTTGDFFALGGPLTIPPELSVFLIYLVDLGVTIQPDGIYILSDSIQIKIASFNGEHGEFSLNNPQKKAVLIKSDASKFGEELLFEFSELTYLFDTLRPIHLLGTNISHISQRPFVETHTIKDCEVKGRVEETIRDLTHILAKHTMLEMDTTAIREERKYVYQVNRVLRIKDHYKLISPEYALKMYEQTVSCIKMQIPN